MQQLSLFDESPIKKPQVELGELFEAYFDCRSNKRNTPNAIAFEIDYESTLIVSARPSAYFLRFFRGLSL